MLYRQFLSGHLLLQFTLDFNETSRYCSVPTVVVQELFYLNVKHLFLELSALGFICYQFLFRTSTPTVYIGFHWNFQVLFSTKSSCARTLLLECQTSVSGVICPWIFVHYMLHRQFLSEQFLLQFILHFNETSRYYLVTIAVVQELFYLNVKLLFLGLSVLGYFSLLLYRQRNLSKG